LAFQRNDKLVEKEKNAQMCAKYFIELEGFTSRQKTSKIFKILREKSDGSTSAAKK